MLNQFPPSELGGNILNDGLLETSGFDDGWNRAHLAVTSSRLREVTLTRHVIYRRHRSRYGFNDGWNRQHCVMMLLLNALVFRALTYGAMKYVNFERR